MKVRMLALLAVVALVAAPASARQPVQGDPGYVDLRRFEKLFAEEPTLEVNLTGSLLRMVAEAARLEDEAFAALLDRIKAIYVRGFSLGEQEAGQMRDRVSALSSDLRDAGWMRIVRVREDGEQVDVLTRESGDRIDGLAVFVVESGDNGTILVNIVGEIRPEEIGRIGRRFAIEALEDL